MRPALGLVAAFVAGAVLGLLCDAIAKINEAIDQMEEADL